jgi:hypothetical protein
MLKCVTNLIAMLYVLVTSPPVKIFSFISDLGHGKWWSEKVVLSRLKRNCTEMPGGSFDYHFHPNGGIFFVR